MRLIEGRLLPPTETGRKGSISLDDYIQMNASQVHEKVMPGSENWPEAFKKFFIHHKRTEKEFTVTRLSEINALRKGRSGA